MTGVFAARLEEAGRPYALLHGPLEQRVRQAEAEVDRTATVAWRFADPL